MREVAAAAPGCGRRSGRRPPRPEIDWPLRDRRCFPGLRRAALHPAGDSHALLTRPSPRFSRAGLRFPLRHATSPPSGSRAPAAQRRRCTWTGPRVDAADARRATGCLPDAVHAGSEGTGRAAIRTCDSGWRWLRSCTRPAPALPLRRARCCPSAPTKWPGPPKGESWGQASRFCDFRNEALQSFAAVGGDQPIKSRGGLEILRDRLVIGAGLDHMEEFVVGSQHFGPL